MNTTMTRAAVALSAVAWLATGAAASELRYSDLEQRLSAVESRLAEQQGVRTAAFLDHDGTAAACGCEQGYACDACAGCPSYACCQPSGFWYSEIQLLWLRLHANPFGAAAPLSDRHYFAPRLVLGYEDPCGVGGRIRYFHWGNTVPSSVPGVTTRHEWDVIDIEATGRVHWGRTDVVFAGGFRYVSWDTINATVGLGVRDADLYGLTFAADARTLVWSRCNSGIYTVYGARLSLLGGDWENAAGTIVAPDDNVVVHELYFGVEYRCCYCGYDLYARAAYEMQRWRTGERGFGLPFDAPDIALIGPGFHVGATF